MTTQAEFVALLCQLIIIEKQMSERRYIDIFFTDSEKRPKVCTMFEITKTNLIKQFIGISGRSDFFFNKNTTFLTCYWMILRPNVNGTMKMAI